MNPKISHIFSCTMSLLKESGDQGLSMRKIAEKADMRLSNLQYYFKTKELLLSALFGSFLEEYSKSVQSIQFDQHSNPQQQLQHLLFYILSDIEKAECAVIFKELWAIAERNSAVKVALDQYYDDLYQMLFDILSTLVAETKRAKDIHRAVSILLPFIEGFCITRKNLPVATADLADQLAVMIHHIISAK